MQIPTGAHRQDRMWGDPTSRVCQLRYKAHCLFDALWDKGNPARRAGQRIQAYAWLRRETHMSKEDCHFSLFDEGVCEAVIEILKEVHCGLREGPRFHHKRIGKDKSSARKTTHRRNRDGIH